MDTRGVEMDNRKNVKVLPHVKEELAALKKMLGVPTESHVIDYLARIYLQQRGKITIGDHEKCLTAVVEDHNQVSL